MSSSLPFYCRNGHKQILVISSELSTHIYPVNVFIAVEVSFGWFACFFFCFMNNVHQLCVFIYFFWCLSHSIKILHSYILLNGVKLKLMTKPVKLQVYLLQHSEKWYVEIVSECKRKLVLREKTWLHVSRVPFHPWLWYRKSKLIKR